MASWDEPTGETPAVHETTSNPLVRRRSRIDQAVATLLIAALIITLAVGAFLFGKARSDSNASVTPTTSSVPVSLDSTTTASTVRSSKASTTTNTTTLTVDTLPTVTVAPSPTTATTAPATTATTATTAPPTTTADTTPP